jgi:hypothetical protein
MCAQQEGKERLLDTHLGVKIRSALASTHGQCGESIFEDLQTQQQISRSGSDQDLRSQHASADNQTSAAGKVQGPPKEVMSHAINPHMFAHRSTPSYIIKASGIFIPN